MNAVHHTHYPDYANPELLEKIPLHARVVLDVGCAQGALGAAYLRRNPRAKVLGIEMDEEAAAVAMKRYHTVAVCDVEAEPMPFEVPEGGIDCIIYGDVLEHMRDPWALLAGQVPYLSAEGTVLVCMPNVENWSLVLSLLNGRFDYEETGLMDRTHLRWFTPRMMGRTLAEAGLQLADVSPRPIDPGPAEKVTAALAPGLQALGIDPKDFLNRATPLQFIWRARKSAPQRLMLGTTMLVPQGGVSDVRVMEPVRAMRTDSAVMASIGNEDDLNPPLKDGPKVAVLHRPLLMGEAGLQRIRALLAKDYVVVAEFDDHPQFMVERGLELDKLLTFKGVHAVQTSTPSLAETLRTENPEIGMFPNAVFELPEVRNFAQPDRLTLIFAALNREEDWAPLMGTLNDVARAVGERLNFQVLHDQGFFNALETPHKTFAPMSDYQTYLKLLAQSDIAFMPLVDTPFNRGKSDLKFIEASACRVAALASDVVYASSIENGKTGTIFRSPAELRSALLRILAYPDAARRMADAARAYVAQERMMAYQIEARNAWYRGLWERRDELNASLKARIPELFA